MTKTQTTDFFIACKESRIENNTNFYGCFYIGPFDDSLTQTLANDLRRTLLSELTGLAITSIEIEGILHRFSSLPGMKETVLDLICNLQNIVLKKHNTIRSPYGQLHSSKKTYVGFLNVTGPRVIKAIDLKLPAGIQCVDPNQYIATLADDGFLNMKFNINFGKSFIKQKPQNLDHLNLKKRTILLQNFKKTLKSEKFMEPSFVFKNKKDSQSLASQSFFKFGNNTISNTIPLDAVFMPVTKINCIIEENNIYSDFSTDLVNYNQNTYLRPKNNFLTGNKIYKNLELFSNFQGLADRDVYMVEGEEIEQVIQRSWPKGEDEHSEYIDYNLIYQTFLILQKNKQDLQATHLPSPSGLLKKKESLIDKDDLAFGLPNKDSASLSTSDNYLLDTTSSENISIIGDERAKQVDHNDLAIKKGEYRKSLKLIPWQSTFGLDKSTNIFYFDLDNVKNINQSKNGSQLVDSSFSKINTFLTGKTTLIKNTKQKIRQRLKENILKLSSNFSLANLSTSQKSSDINRLTANFVVEPLRVWRSQRSWPQGDSIKIPEEVQTSSSSPLVKGNTVNYSLKVAEPPKINTIKTVLKKQTKVIRYANKINSINQQNVNLEYAKTLKLKPLRKKSHLIVEIWTNGSIHPRQALSQAFIFLSNNFLKLQTVKILGSMFKTELAYGNIKYSILNNYNTVKTTKNIKKEISTKSKLVYPQLINNQSFYLESSLKAPIGILKISLRAYTALKKAGIFTLSDLLSYTKSDLLKIKNLGKKSLYDIETSLAYLGLTLKNI